MSDVLDLIDWDAVAAAIRAEPLEHWAYEDAAKITWNVAERFFVRDMERYEWVAQTEFHWAIVLGRDGINTGHFGEERVTEALANYRSGDRIVHGYTDLVALGYSEDGQRRTDIIDWKTAGELDKSWRDKLADSWQWRIYCYVHAAAGFIYRGLDRNGLAPKIPGQPYDWGKAPMSELGFVAPASNEADVCNYLATVFSMREALENRFPLGRWPRRMPDGCRYGAQRCPRWDVCRDVAPLPEGVYKSKPLSYSGLGRFLNCPENYRLATIQGGKDASSYSELGNAVHRGVAALYDQFNHVKEQLSHADEATPLP